MKKIVVASIAAFAALVVTSNMAATAIAARDHRAGAVTGQRDAAPAATWLVTANVFDAEGKLLLDEPLYYRQAAVRFNDEASCKAFVASGDAELSAANDGLKVQMVAAFGEGTEVRVSCSIEPSV